MGVILLLTVLLIVITDIESCSTKELERCLVVLRSVAEREDLALATTKQELQLVCRKLQEGVKCIDDHSSRCFNSAQLRVYDSVVSESRQVIEDICVEGKLQEDYLSHAPCFKNISTDSKKCALKYRKMAILSQELKEEDKDSALKSVCCALRDFTLCKHEHAIRDCGPGASQFLQRHMERMSGSLINEHCVLYTYGAGSCSSHFHNSRSPSRGHWTFLFFLVLCLWYSS
ncbi:uncharacterized protein NPIL_305231 [Nephila pilipes]|uniref:Uncharacterized protein n=1 Tax=Nephila pilipes TaxID=299642 RepID=A0A8X6TDI5_NEPPI|nr:uncharacterized protein NPIL_305231 [Nephila pilipes]